MSTKLCTHAGCRFPCAKTARFCGKHCNSTLQALRASSDYRPDDHPGPPGRSGVAEVAYERLKAEQE